MFFFHLKRKICRKTGIVNYRKIHNPANDSEQAVQPTTSHHEISFENSQAADEAFGNLRKQAENINGPQSPDEQSKNK